MSKTSTVTATATVTGDGVTGLAYTPPQYPLTNVTAPGGGPDPLTLAAGANVLPVRAGAIGYMLVPTPGSTNAKIVNDTGAGATGITFKSNPVHGSIESGQANLYINAAASETIAVFWF